MADLMTLKKFEALSPFEIKDELINLAKATSKTTQSAFLNAGRGNPNWIATTPREGFFLLGQFAMTESKRVMEHPAGIGGMPQASGIAARLEAWLAKHSDMPGAGFLSAMTKFAVKKFGFEPDAFVHELVNSIIGDNYPVPDRMLGSQRADRAGVSAVGDVRRAAAGRQVRSLRGRGRNGRDVLHLQIAEGQPAVASRRHDCAGHADLHALSRDDASRGLRPQGRAHQERRRRTASSTPMRKSRSWRIRRSRPSSSSIPAIPPAWR